MAADLFQFSLDPHDVTVLSEDPTIIDDVSCGRLLQTMVVLSMRIGGMIWCMFSAARG